MINFVIIGGGWRAEFYLRIAKALSDQFYVSAICIRNQQRAKEIARKFSVKVVGTIQDVLSEPFDFVVNCINKEDVSDLAVQLADEGHYVLCETPIVKAPKEGHSYEKIQVAEQFHLKGTYQALKKILDSGIIGNISHIHLSVAHDYHAMSLMRFFLQDDNEPKILCNLSLPDKMMRTNGRIGIFSDKREEETSRVIKMFQFGKATGIYDYNVEQYFSPIRKDRILICGSRGEIENNSVRYLNENNEPVTGTIAQVTSGLLDGFFWDKITFESQVLYEFPFPSARLSEEEIAIAQCLLNMKKYIQTGKELYHCERAYLDWFYFHCS